MALSLDTSCVLKLFFAEPETAATVTLIAREPHVVVSSLTRLEALVHIHGRVAARMLSAVAARRLIERFDQVLRSEP